MHARQRIGPANGYRSNAMGIRGMAAPSRISPEGSMRGHRAYNSDHRNYNRGGYGRGGSRSRQFQPPAHPPRETDIFIEAGRLAAEYLVSKGVLPQTALSGKWRNDGWKNQAGDFLGFRPCEDVQIPLGGRESAHSRSGSSTLDVGAGRRRNSDEYNSIASRNSFRERRTGSFKDYESDVNKEWGRSGSGAETSRAEAVSDALASNHDNQPAGKDCNDGMQASSPGGITQGGDDATDLESGLEKCNSVENASAKAGSSDGKHPASGADEETIKDSDDANKFHADMVKEGEDDNHVDQKQDAIKEMKVSAKADPLVIVDNVDLSKHSKFENVCSEARFEQDPMKEDENNAERVLSEGSGIDAVDSVNGISAGNDSSCKNHELKSLESDVLHAPCMEKKPDTTYPTVPGQRLGSGSFPERSVHKEQEPHERLSGFGSSNSMLMERGEKRVMDNDIDCREGSKKLRQWVPSMDVQSDGCLPLSSAMDNRLTLHEHRTPQSSHVTLSPEQNSLSVSLFSKGPESSEFMQEKQLFPGSFKTCDLNLAGTGDVNDNHDADSALFGPSVLETQKEVIPLDVGLSMSNNFNMPKRNGKHGINDTDIEVIDLENDSVQEDQAFISHDRRGDAVFNDLVDGFPNNLHNTNETSSGQDGYGLMISELLGNGSPNCSSVPTDLNSLHNDVGLPSAEVTYSTTDDSFDIPVFDLF
ncbi:hypothetical protein CDL12_15527 [Handroanthus impetiginosus]|uniref:Uncharacterized protein n=1 Tax=Handroanthus impetiginosus TaxID=429701 RepID=A0A2G9H2X0_9LAMI|nr:hypothetical protein CDL12_15527 [Handroanthus impetiginosus]